MTRFLRLLSVLIVCSLTTGFRADDSAQPETSAILSGPQEQAVAALVFAHPSEVENLYRQIGAAQFTALVRAIPAADWATAAAQQQQQASTFAKKAPKSAAVILAWMASDSTPPAPPPVTPAPPAPPAGTWSARITRPMFFMAGPQYYWDDVPAAHVRPWLTAIRDAGLTGPSIEFQGSFPVDEYNTGKPGSVDVAKVYRDQFAAWRAWLPVIRELGLVAHIAFLNSNQSHANNMPDSWWYETAKAFALEFGSANLLILPLSETDSRTRASVGQAIERGLRDGGFPAAQLIGYGSRGDRGFLEHHPKDNASIQRGDFRILNIPDNGKAIGSKLLKTMYGPNWQSGGSPQLGEITKFTDAVQAAGTGGGLYSFGRSPDLQGLEAASQAWRK